MKIRMKQWTQSAAALFCIAALLIPGIVAHADSIDTMEEESSNLKTTLNDIDGELLEIGQKIAENEVQIDQLNGEIEQTGQQLAIARQNEEKQYEDMKLRIQYIYENNQDSMLGMILSSESLTEFVNRVDFVSSMNQYDRDKVEELQKLRENIESEENRLKEQQNSCAELKEELKAREEELNSKAVSVSADLDSLSAKIQQLKSEEAARAFQEAQAAAEAAASAKEETNQKAEAAAQVSSDSSTEIIASADSSSNSSSSSSYIYPSGAGQLNPWVGVVYYNGHRETYYSQKVLPGGGLSIPGRHVAEDGTVRDGDGYICLASSDYPKGTVVETSLGTGKVYDSGCASGTIDIYTDW